jgi:hypothetical protein
VLVSFSFPGGFCFLRDKTERAGAGPGRWCGCEATPTLTGGAAVRGAGMSATVRVCAGGDELGGTCHVKLTL